MNSRIWVGGGAVAIVGVLVGGWFLGAQPLLAQAASNDAERRSVRELNVTQEARLAELEELNGSLASLQRDADELTAALPGSAAMSAFLGEVSEMAVASEVTVTSLTAGEAQLVSEAAAAAGVGGAAPAAPAEGGAAEETSADTEVTAEPVPATSELTSVAVTLSATGSLDGLSAFLDRLHDGERYLSISAATIVEDSAGSGGFRLDLTGAVYLQTPAA